jgi:hypothetical protein
LGSLGTVFLLLYSVSFDEFLHLSACCHIDIEPFCPDEAIAYVDRQAYIVQVLLNIEVLICYLMLKSR